MKGVNAEIPDAAFGAAGFGDFPIYDGANSQYDVPYYLVHRIMTARTADGLADVTTSFQYKSIITDGLGPWFAAMRGGDEPEQGWEALRQAATGIGLTYPDAYGGTEMVPPFNPATPAIAIARISAGKAKKISVMRITASSTQPPR